MSIKKMLNMSKLNSVGSMLNNLKKIMLLVFNMNSNKGKDNKILTSLEPMSNRWRTSINSGIKKWRIIMWMDKDWKNKWLRGI